MRFAVLSDIHANLPALQVVLDHAVQHRVDQYLFIGDLVVYGPHPNECVERLYDLMADSWQTHAIAGNNDSAVACKLDPQEAATNIPAQKSYEWTLGAITPQNLKRVESLPGALEPDQAKPIIASEQITIFHGTIADPIGRSMYMEQDDFTIKNSLRRLPTSIGIYGHTHKPAIYRAKPKSETDLFFSYTRILPDYNSDGTFLYSFADLEVGERLLINSGSVGQPRDNNPKVAYVIVDEMRKTADFFRLEYDIASVQEDMYKFGLPENHINRLAEGR
ncbi:MAG: metallophosphoesterase family protein [Chloroflexi bacterium]|nr:metallophosphoesterase family protein [Chloroflexota bacterium]